MSMSYMFRKGFHAKGLDAEKANEALREIERKNGGDLTSEAVVQAAKGKKHYLHDYFDWDDKTAAHKHRKSQAATLQGSIMLVHVEADETPIETRAWVNIVRTESDVNDAEKEIKVRTFKSIEDVLADPFERLLLVQKVFHEMKAVREKYQMLHEFDQLFKTIDRFEAKYGKAS